MPRIPTRDSLAQLTPRPTGGIVQAPRDFVGGALVDVGNDIYAKAEKEKKQQSALELAKARSEWNSAILTEQSAYTLDQNPDYGNWNKKYEPRSKVWQKRAAENISDPVVQKQFMLETEDDRVRIGLGINGSARKIGVQERFTAANAGLEKLVDNAAAVDAPDDAQRVFSDINATIKDLVDTGVITAAQGADRAMELGRKYASLKVQQDIEKDPAAAYSHITGQAGDSYFSRLARKESGGRDNAKAPTSSATGRYQFIDSTWEMLRKNYPELNLTRDGRTDPAQADRAIRKFTALNAEALNNAGLAATEANLYLAHFMGAGGAIQMLQADPNAVASQAFPEAAKANATIFFDRDGRPRTVQEVIAIQTKGFAGGGQAPAYYNMLSADQRMQFGRAAEAESKRREAAADARFATRRAELDSLLSNDLQSVLNTGKPTQVDESEVLSLLGPSKYNNWLDAREDAGQVFSETENMAMLGDAQISEIVARNVPKAGSDNYERKLKVYEEIQKRADAITKERRDNPAKAALRMPDVTRALSEAQDPRTSSPQKVQAFVRQMMATQSTFDVPRSAIAPVPDEWAYEIGRVFLKFPAELNSSNADQVAQALTATYQQMEQQYGEYADDVIAYSIEKSKALSKDMSKHVTTLLKSVASGRPITRAEREAAMLADQQAADQTSSSWWNPTTWFGGDNTSPTDPDKMPTRDEIASALSMEDDQARSEALQALVDEYGEAAVTAARTMYQ